MFYKTNKDHLQVTTIILEILQNPNFHIMIFTPLKMLVGSPKDIKYAQVAERRQ